MPYITQEARDELSSIVGEFFTNAPYTSGELQYIIASLLNENMKAIKEERGSVRYQDMNDMMGALVGAQQEFYRCVVAPYEDEKISENGGVYGHYTSRESY